MALGFGALAAFEAKSSKFSMLVLLMIYQARFVWPLSMALTIASFGLGYFLVWWGNKLLMAPLKHKDGDQTKIYIEQYARKFAVFHYVANVFSTAALVAAIVGMIYIYAFPSLVEPYQNGFSLIILVSGAFGFEFLRDSYKRWKQDMVVGQTGVLMKHEPFRNYVLATVATGALLLVLIFMAPTLVAYFH